MRDPITGQLVAGYSNRDPFTGQLVRLGRRRPIAVGIWEDMPLERTAIATAGNYYVSRGQFRNTSGRKLGSLRLVYPGTVRANGAPVEYGLGNDYTATAAFEYTSSQGPMVQDGTRPLVTFTGGLGGLVPNGGHRLSDPAPFEIEAGAYAYVRSGMTVGTNGHFVPTGAACQGLATDFGRGTGDGVQTAQANNAAVYDGGAAITITNQVLLGFRPLVVTDDSDGLTCAVFVGDSNQAGSPDAEKGPRRGGWGVRSAEINGCSAMRLAMSGDRAEWVAKHSSSFGRRQLWRYGTHGVLAEGTNDILTGQTDGKTSAEILDILKANILAAARAMVIDGLAAAVATILPLNGSTNVFVDLAGQTLANGIVEGARKPFNVWARGNGFRDDLLASLPPSVRPYARIGECFDACAPIECNVAGVLTAGGGYVIPGQIVKTGTLTSGSQYVLGDTGAAMGINDYKGLILVMTSGAAAGSTFPIRDNTAIEFRSAEGMSSGVPSAGDTYRIVRVVKREYLHLTSWGEELVAAAMAPILARYIRI